MVQPVGVRSERVFFYKGPPFCYKILGERNDGPEIGLTFKTGYTIVFSKDNKVAITDPVYPVYLDTNTMAGRSGKYNKETGKYENIIYMPCTS